MGLLEYNKELQFRTHSLNGEPRASAEQHRRGTQFNEPGRGCCKCRGHWKKLEGWSIVIFFIGSVMAVFPWVSCCWKGGLFLLLRWSCSITSCWRCKVCLFLLGLAVCIEWCIHKSFLPFRLFFFNPHQRWGRFSLLLETDKHWHRTVASLHSLVGESNLRPRYVPWPGIKPVTFPCMGKCSTQLSYTGQGLPIFILNEVRVLLFTPLKMT